jgi:hypothetical protein
LVFLHRRDQDRICRTAPAPLPAHREILLASGLVTGGSLLPDTAAWLSA